MKTYHNASQGDEEDEDVSPHWVVVGPHPRLEEVNLRVKLVLSEGLEHPGGPHEASDGGADGGGETAAVDEVASGGYDGHGLLVGQSAVLAGFVSGEGGG